MTDVVETSDLVSLNLRVPRDLKGRVVVLAGGQRKVSAYVTEVLDAVTQGRVPVEKGREEPREEPRDPAREVDDRPALPSRQMLNAWFGVELVDAVAKKVGSDETEEIAKFMATMSRQALAKIAAPVKMVDDGDRTYVVAGGSEGCKHVFGEPLNKFGRTLQFCQKDGCDAKKFARR